MDRALITRLVKDIQDAAEDDVMQSASRLGDRLPSDYLERLSDQDKLDVVRACVIMAAITEGRVVPRVFQLEATLAMLNHRDCIVIAGTGSGKTLCILIPLLLRPGSLSITISPLKRLQTTQVLESERYGINTIAINEDTPNDEALWRSIRGGHFQHLIVSPEQLGPYNGHLPRLARLLRENRTFLQKIERVNIDEAHNIHTAGLPHHGEAAFRPAYGKLGHLRPLLSKSVPMQVLSATLPDHVLMTIKTQLGLSSNALELRLSSNRPNITYATFPITGLLRNFENLSFLIPSTFHPPMIIPKTLVFHDSKQEATSAAAFIESRLPQCLQDVGIVKHYHSDMSAQYLQQTFEDFSQPNGTCRILHATAGAATGLDIRGVAIVIQYGVCKNMAEAAQRAGRAARDPNSTGLFLTMVEPWALSLSLEGINITDPDQPFARTMKKTSSKQERTSIASIQYVQSQTCLRKFFATYLRDESQHALDFAGLWCCDRHYDNGFNLNQFFHGQVHASSIPSEDNPQSDSKTTKRKRNVLRALSERQELLNLLIDWREQAHKRDRFSLITWIVNDSDLELVSRTHPSNLNCLQDLVLLLAETEDWAQEYGHEMIKIITEFETTVAPTRKRTSTNTRPVKKTKRIDGSDRIIFASIQTPESFSTT